MREEYLKFVAETRKKLLDLPSSCRLWWKLSTALMMNTGKVSSVPPLKAQEGTWIVDPEAKAEHFAKTFWSKYELPVSQVN